MSVSDTLQNDKGQRRALKSLLDGSAPAMAAKQDSTLAPGALGPGSRSVGVAEYLSGNLPNISAIGEVYPDNSTDNAAVFAAALASGRRYFVPPGLYRCNSALVPTSGSGLIGLAGQTKIVRGGQNFHQINLSTTAGAITGVVLSGIYLDGKVATYATTIWHAIYSDCPDNALSDILIEDCQIVDTAGAGILLLTNAAGSGGIILRNNRLTNIGYQPINLQVNGGTTAPNGFTDCLITGNRILDYSMTVVDAPGITCGRGGGRNIVSNNHVRQVSAPFSGTVSAQGISVEGSDHAVTGNFIQGAHGIGIEIGFADRTTVTGNTCLDCTKGGIAVSGDNTANDNVSDGVTISGNTCDGNKNGIEVFVNDDIGNSLTHWHENISIAGNGCHKNTDHGIFVFGVKRLAVVGNACHENAKSGIIVGYTGATAAIYSRANRDVMVASNSFYANNGAASASYAGMQIFAASSVTDSNAGTAVGYNHGHNNGSGDSQTFLDNVLNPLINTTVTWMANTWRPIRPLSRVGNTTALTNSSDYWVNSIKAQVLDADSYTATDLGNIAHAVNTSGKSAKRLVYNSTSSRYMHAVGSSTNSAWVDLAGGNAITPA